MTSKMASWGAMMTGIERNGSGRRCMMHARLQTGARSQIGRRVAMLESSGLVLIGWRRDGGRLIRWRGVKAGRPPEQVRFTRLSNA
eukprot:scaffold6370_cov78-Skeletonema_dohrnii-CCMP3373.AAC.2